MSEQNVNLTFDLFQSFMHQRAPALAMDVELCDLSDLAPAWVQSSKEIARPDGGFFRVIGMRVLRAAGKAASFWMQPMIGYQTSGYVGLVVCRMGEQDLVLVQLIAEPGNVGIWDADGKNTRVLVGPSFQFSQGNLAIHEKAKRGECDAKGNPFKLIPFADSVKGKTFNAEWQPAPEDGGRFFEKVNNYGRVRVTDMNDVLAELEKTGAMENYSWTSIPVLRQLCRLGLVNGHLRSSMSLLV